MSSFNQGVPGPATLINSSNCIVYGNTTSGTALTVQQLGAGAVMNVATSTGSSALFVSSTGQVGIGQTAPQTLLHVTATAANSAIFIDNSITGGATPYNTVRPSASGAGSANCHIWSDGNAVGTSDAGFLRIAAGGGTAGITKSYIDLSGYSTVTDMNQNIVFGTSGSEKMRITSGGNVGIGLTNPGAQLTLTSNLYAGGMIQSAGATGGITNQGAYMAWNLSTARGETDFINQQGLGSGGWNWYSYNSSNQLTSNAAYLSSTGGLTLGTYSNAYTAPSGGLICPGNVGIGVTNPGYPLDVLSSSTSLFRIQSYNDPAIMVISTYFDTTKDCAIRNSNGQLGFTASSTPGTPYIKFFSGASGAFTNLLGGFSSTLTGGATTLSVDANGYIIRTPSDERLKSNIRAISYGLSDVEKLAPVCYEWKSPDTYGVGRQLGMIAQEVQQIIPECVSGGETLSLDYQKLVPVLTKAIQELSTKNDALEQRLAALEQSLATATANNSSLESKLAA